MIKFKIFREKPTRFDVRSVGGSRAAAAFGMVMLGALPAALAQTPRVGSSAWYGTSRGQAPSGAANSAGIGANSAANSPGGTAGGAVNGTASVARSMANFTQAARAIAQAQAAQRQAAAQPSAHNVPDGLRPGGLVIAPGAGAPNSTVWSGANLPTSAASAGATGAAGHTGGTIVTVQQTAQTANLTWSSFNIGANTTLQFLQGKNTWTVLNQVRDPNLAPSTILGAINAPGEVLILNANGILFGAGSQVNVGALVASTANLAAAQFNATGFNTILSSQSSNGAYLPAFTGATAPVTVEAGATIATNTSSSATQSGGFVLLMGQSVTNAGMITTANGQTVLAAGGDFVLKDGYSAVSNPTSTTLGLEVDATNGGSVTNTGLIQAMTGDITLTGQTLLQSGVLLSSTTVGQRGTIHLLTNTTDPTSSITFAPGSLTAIQPRNDGTTATDDARTGLINQSATNNGKRATVAATVNSLLPNQHEMPDQQYQSRIEIVSGGTVVFQNGSLALSTGGQIAAYATGRFFVGTGATLSVAGSVDTVLPASANSLQIGSVQGFDLRDAPANRDTGLLTSQTVNIAIGSLVQIGALQYTSGGLLEVSGYVGGIEHTIGEWTSIGGTITLAAGEVVAQPGASFNISGGLVTYAAGTTPNTWLTASNGRVYNVNTAPANLTYTGVYDGFTVDQPRWSVTETFISPLIAPATTYNPAYTVGRDAGTLTIDATTTVMEGSIAAGVSTGQFQNGARPSGTTDPFTFAQTVVPLPGTLVIGPVTLGPPAVLATDVRITPDGDAIASTLNPGITIPADRAGTTWLSASLPNDAGLGGLTIVTSGAIQVDAPVTLADGGAISLLAPNVSLTGSLTARGGRISLGNASTVYATLGFVDTMAAGGVPAPNSVTLGPNATIDTRGVFTNLTIDPLTSAGEAFANGGPVTIDTSGQVTLPAGALIDASAGGAVLANRATKGAAGGAISITAYDPNDINAPATTGPVVMAATLRAFGSGMVPCTSCVGGALTLTVPGIVIGGAAADSSTVALTADFFAAGFSSYTITGENGLAVADGSRIAVTQPIQQFTAATAVAASGTDPAAAFTIGLPALFTPIPATATMNQRPGASITLRAGTPIALGGGITIGTGSVISVDPLQTIGLEAEGQITIDGTLNAPSGTITVVNDQFVDRPGKIPQDLGAANSLSIWLGSTSVLNVAAQAATTSSGTGQIFGSVPDGGTIRIGGQGGTITNVSNPAFPVVETTDAVIIIQPGAILDASGTSAMLNPTAGQNLAVSAIGRSALGQPALIASNGGSISFDSEGGMFLGGQIRAPAGGPNAQGGTLSVNLLTPNYTDTAVLSIVPDFPIFHAPRELVIGTSEAASPGVTQPGVALPVSAFGLAKLSTGQIAAGGFDVLNLSSGDAILFDGTVTLSAARSITLSTAILGETGTAGAASVIAPYVTLAGTGTATQSGMTFRRATFGANGGAGNSPEWQPSGQATSATLAVNAANIDISGNMYVSVNAPLVAAPTVSQGACAFANCAVADLPGFASMTLSSAGDIRFLPSSSATVTTFTTPGNLTLVAGQVYPVANTNAVVTAGLTYDPGVPITNYGSLDTLSYDGTLVIASAPGPTPAAPLTAGGAITLRAELIEQGGVLRAPEGRITLGLGASSQFAPNLGADVSASQVVLLPGSITSISMNGLTIPYGGTSDGTTYTLNGTAVNLTATFPPQIALNGQVIQVQAGATIDVGGGGVLAGAGFVSGRGGSTDILQAPLLALSSSGVVTQPQSATNPVFAIIPGFAGSAAPPTATATPYTGALPLAGDQITIGAGVPGLPAGTYTLLPGSDALLPGAFRVQLATSNHTILPGTGTINLGNGSYLTDGYRGVANTSIRVSLPVEVTVTPGAAVRLDAQYDETSFSNFALSQAALFNTPRASLTLPSDAKILSFGFPAAAADDSGLALRIRGTVLSAPGADGLGGIVEITAAAKLEVIPDSATPTPAYVSILGSDLSGLRANTLIVGGTSDPNFSINQERFVSSTTSVTIRDGATLSAAQVFLVANGGITVERGASITTIGDGTPSLDSSGGLSFSNSSKTVLAVSNGNLLFIPATGGGAIAIGNCAANCAGAASLSSASLLSASLLSSGTIATVTTGSVSLDSSTILGTAALDLSASLVNFGTPPANAPPNVLAGLTFSADALRGLIAGNAAQGIPGLQQLTLSATGSIDFWGAFNLNTVDPVTGQSTLRSVQLNTPAIYGGPGANVALTTGTFIWNGVKSGSSISQLPGQQPDNGSAPGTLAISANTIVLGYGPADQAQSQVSLDRLILGFSSVTLTANQSIAGNNRGTLSVYQTGTQDSTGKLLTGTGGNLTLSTPLLSGAPGSVLTISAGGNLTITAPASPRAAGPFSAQGASLTLNAANISDNTAIVLPSGQLIMNAQGAIALGDGSRIDLSGIATTLFDQTTYGWGGDVTLQAGTGSITQTAGGSIDVSANGAAAGSITVLTPGVVSLGGKISGGAGAGFASGSFSVRASGLGGGDLNSDFVALNANLDSGGFFGGRSFEFLAGDLTIGAGTTVKASTVSVSVDAGALTVAGTVHASGATPGTIRLSAGGNLTLAAGAVLDAHGTVAQVDSYGQSIDSENTASVTLTSASGTLSIGSASAGASAPVIDVSAPAGVTCALGLCGQVTLNAPRTDETSGGVNISAAGPVTIRGAGGIVVNAFWTYAPTDPNGTIVQDNGTLLPASSVPVAAINAAGAVGLAQIGHNSQIFMSNADANATLQANLAGLAGDGSIFHLRPGVEIDSATPASNLTVASDLDLSVYRYSDPAGYGRQVDTTIPGSGEPGALVIRAGGNLTINGSINDGFSGAPALCAIAATCTTPFTYWELAQPILPAPNGAIPLSWSIRLVAGADLNAADSRTVLPATLSLPATTGTAAGLITLNDPHPQPFNADVPNASSFQLPGWSVIRTGTGDLELLAGGSINEQSTYAIYTAGGVVPVDGSDALPRGTTTPPVLVASAGTVNFKLTTSKGPTTVAAGTTLTDASGNQFILGSTIRVVLVNGVSQTCLPGSGACVPSGPVPITPRTATKAFSDEPGATLSVSRVTGVQAVIVDAETVSLVPTVLGTNGQAVNNGKTLESLVSGYQAWYPTAGGNLLLSAGGNITGYLAIPSPAAFNQDGVQPMDGVGNWLWRQGGSSGVNTAWWINFGTLALPLQSTGLGSATPTLTGFTGIGTLGGGNATILAGGSVGETTVINSVANTPYTVTQAIDVTVASTGRVSPGASSGSGIIQTGGGILTIRAGGALNGSPDRNNNSNQANGTLTDTRGSIAVHAASIGQIPLTYGAVNFDPATGVGDPLSTSALTASEANPLGGPIVVPGDATVSLEARGDLVLGGAGDPTRLTAQNLTPASATGGLATGLTWFSLWQPDTAINLVSAGGNLVVSTQALVAGAKGQQENAIATDNRFLYPPTLTATAASGSIYAGTTSFSAGPSSLELAPSPVGQLALIAAGSVYGDSGVSNGQPQSFDVSGAPGTAVPTPLNAAVQLVAPGIPQLTTPLSLFALGFDTASGTLHAGDTTPSLIYAGGDIVNLRYGETLAVAATTVSQAATWYVSGKALVMMAGGDIIEPGTLPGQLNPTSTTAYSSTSGLIVNNNTSDVSIIQAGGEILYANATVAGPGQLYVQAGGNVYQGNQGELESLGPLSNGALSTDASRKGGAGITVLAGVTNPAWQGFAQTYLAPAMDYGASLLSYLQTDEGYTGDQAGAVAFFEALPLSRQRTFLLNIYFGELNASGNEFNDSTSVRFKSYARGREAIAALFPTGSTSAGDITLFGNAGIRTDFGGAVTLLTPGGATTLGNTVAPSSSPTAPPAGVLTQGTGDVDVYSQGSVILGQSRVFTTFGGNIVIWSAQGDINAGRGSKTTQLVSTPSLVHDNFGRVTLTPGIPTSGAGIATLAPIPGTALGLVNLIAPLGVIDAGEAGIRASGNVNLAALTVVNAANVQSGGKATGLPTIAAPNVSALSSAGATSAAAAQAAQQASASAGSQNNQQAPTTITVELLGVGDQ